MNYLTNLIIVHPVFSISLAVIIIVLLIAFNVFLGIELIKLRRKNKTLFKGTKGKDLEEVIHKQLGEIKKLDSDIQDLFKVSEKIHSLAARGIQKVGVIRFNPFKDIGGDQSFAIALLDSFDNGVIISSLYSREGTRIYTKPIEKGVSSHNLSDEEQEAIKRALQEIK